MSGGATQPSLRKYLGAIKDSTTVGLANLNSEFKELDIAIVKATNHVERPAKEKHIRAIFSAISAARPRADVAYCIHALSRRLSKTHNWAVALKTLIAIHRALREVDPTFREELINYGRSRGHMLNLSHFKDDSSQQAWDYSAWIRTYALYLEEKLECFRVVKYDVETEPARTRDLDTVDLLEQLPALQQLLFRLLNCQPQGAATYNFIIHLALSMVAGESIKLYNAISNGTVNLVDKFFDMERHNAVKALEIYKRAGQQAERLSEFYEICKSIDVRRGEGFIKIEQPPASFVTAMEEFVREAPRVSTVRKDQVLDNKLEAPKEVLALEYKVSPEVSEPPKPPSPPPEPVKVEASEPEPADLLGLQNEINPHATELDNRNALALAIIPVDNLSSAPPPTVENSTTGWELALVTAPSSNETATSTSKLAGGLDKLTLDSLYDDALRRANQTTSYNPWEMPPVGGPNMFQPMMTHDPFYGSNTIAAPPNVQMAMMAQQQQAFVLQQQQQQQQQQQHQHQHQQQHQMMMTGLQPQQAPSNPFVYPNAPVSYHQTPNTYTGLI